MSMNSFTSFTDPSITTTALVMNLIDLTGLVAKHFLPFLFVNPFGQHLPFFSGGYRSRTDDPLRARQVLWPAELIPH